MLTLKKINKCPSLIKKSIGAFLLCATSVAHASTTGGGGSNPWDPALTQIQSMLTGDIAHFLIIFAIAGSGIGFIKGGDHGGFMHKALAVVLGGSIAVGAVSLYQTLNLGGAVI